MLVTIEVSTAHSCNVEMARYWIFIYGLLCCVMRNLSCTTSDVTSKSEV